MKLRDQAYQRFTLGLLAREIHAGQFVSQRELAAITGMTLGAIRELIPRLEADGLIRTVPQRGIQIAHVDVNLIRNAFGFRLLVEREAFARFAEKAGDEELDRLQADHEAVLKAAAKGATPALVARAQRAVRREPRGRRTGRGVHDASDALRRGPAHDPRLRG